MKLAREIDDHAMSAHICRIRLIRSVLSKRVRPIAKPRTGGICAVLLSPASPTNIPLALIACQIRGFQDQLRFGNGSNLRMMIDVAIAFDPVD
jgi:hypothetical protein